MQTTLGTHIAPLSTACLACTCCPPPRICIHQAHHPFSCLLCTIAPHISASYRYNGQEGHSVRSQQVDANHRSGLVATLSHSPGTGALCNLRLHPLHSLPLSLPLSLFLTCIPSAADDDTGVHSYHRHAHGDRSADCCLFPSASAGAVDLSLRRRQLQPTPQRV